MTKLFLIFVVLGVTFVPVLAQDQPATQPAAQPSAEDQEKEKAEREKNAYRLLDQVIAEAQTLRLTENRVRVQITAADLLWDTNQGRARSLFAQAADGVAELNRNQQNSNNRRGGGPPNRSFQLRQELVLTAARHDAQLAYQLLALTKAPATTIELDQNARNRFQFSADDNLEQLLLGRVAALDPKFAATNAEQMMDKGTFPRSLPEVLNQLQKQDADAAAKLADKTVKKLQTANMLTNNDAANLAQLLLMAGPRPADANANATATNTTIASTAGASVGRTPVLAQSAYVDLLGSVVDLALKATPGTQTNARPAGPGGGVGRGVGPANTGGNTQSTPTDADLEQNGARRLLAGLQRSLPLVDQYLPSKSAQVRQKLAEVGISTNSPMNFVQTLSALQGDPTADALVQAAATAPPQMQTRLYQQAAFKALEDGDTTRARQIATDHLQANARDVVMQRIDFREMTAKADGARLEDIRQMVARAQSDAEKIDLLLQIASDAQKANPKLAGQLLDEAKQMTSRRATSYDQFEQQLKVAHAFAAVDPARSFEVLEPGIGQLNELLQAASVLSGFEVNVFRDGEMSMQAGSGLTSMVNRYGQELAQLARLDFERSETLAGRFQFPEPRIMARLAIVQGLLGVKPTAITQGPINFFRN
ncbi:MAG TPA: hypothetical protein VJ749_09530 [Pyrinomonadaceae bacterium]|nr:hypothetical protein [Pyrinomonadaceae bacterium]